VLHNKTALLVDDNRSNLLVIQSELLRLGFVVTAVNHPDRVAQTLEAMDRIDIVFLDLEMPSQDGFVVFENLLALGIEAPIVAYTVHLDQLAKVREAGFNGLIAKPLDIDRFPAALEDILKGGKVWLT
jgi:two-component system, cell cycle response regulator DivK